MLIHISIYLVCTRVCTTISDWHPPGVCINEVMSKKTISDTFELKGEFLHAFGDVHAASVLIRYVRHHRRYDSRSVLFDQGVFRVQLYGSKCMGCAMRRLSCGVGSEVVVWGWVGGSSVGLGQR